MQVYSDLNHKCRFQSVESQKLAEAAGCKILFLHPHSPDLNPIEKYWENMKAKGKELLPKVKTFAEALDGAALSI